MSRLSKMMEMMTLTCSNLCVLILDLSRRAVAKWVPQEIKLHATYKAARVDKMKLDRFWFYESMQKIMLKDKPKGWEVWQDDDSDEEDSDYEEVEIPKKKQAKRKRGANEAASSKRIKPNPKPQIRIPKKSLPPIMLNQQAPKKRPRASMDPPGPPPGPPPKRFKPSESKPSSIPSRR